MSIQSEIERINNNVAETYSALEEKGAAMPEAQNSDNLAATARSVPVGSGVTSWDELTDKPFGVVGVRNSITWSGNPGSFENAQPDQWVKVSDALVTEADITAGANISWFSENQYSASESYGGLPYSVNGDTIEVWVAEARYGSNVCVAQFRPNGVFFTKQEGVEGDTYPVSITLPGYGKFPIVKPVEGEYLPAALQFGDVPGSDTWRIEDNFFGSVTDATADNYFKVSDAIVTMDDLALGFTIREYVGGEIRSYTNDQGGAAQQENGIIDIPFIDEVGNATHGVRCYPEGLAHDPGVYVHYENENWYVESFTINGFDGFYSTKLIDEKYLPKSSSGASSWNDLTDKPFGVVGMGDTLEWDGDINTPKTIIASAYGGANTFYKVSDIIITAQDLANGAYTGMYSDSFDEIGNTECTFANNKIRQMEDGAIWLAAEDSWGNYISGWEVYCYPENSTYSPGIYFGALMYEAGKFTDRVVSLTIPGYGKFPVTKTVEPKYLPMSLRFGETDGFSNTLVWDGNTSRLERYPAGPDWFILSDVHVTLEDLANGFYIEAPFYNELFVDFFNPANSLNGDAHSINTEDPDNIYINHIDENGNEWPLFCFTPSGVLVYSTSDMMTDWETGETFNYGVRLHTLTIPGFNRFANPVNNTIDPKYLPKARPIPNCYAETVSQWEFNDLLSALREAGYLAK